MITEMILRGGKEKEDYRDSFYEEGFSDAALRFFETPISSLSQPNDASEGFSLGPAVVIVLDSIILSTAVPSAEVTADEVAAPWLNIKLRRKS